MGIIDSVLCIDKWVLILKLLGYKVVFVVFEDVFKEFVLYKRRLLVCDMLVILCGYLSGKGYFI